MSPLPTDPDSPAGPELVDEERVRAALRRAAQLQAEAVERLEQGARDRIPAQTGSGGFRRQDVEEAAVQAGISPEYIRQALMEQDTLGEHAADLAPWMDRLGSRMLRSRQRSIEVTRTIDAEPQAVLEAMQRVFPAHPYGLLLVDAVGGMPLEGGVLVFDLPRISVMSGTSSYTSFSYAATAVDLLQLHVTLHPMRTEERTRCTVTMRGDLRTSTRRNVWAALGLSGLGGGVGAIFGAAATVAAGAAAPLLVVGALAGFAGLGGASAAGYGALYRSYLKKMIRELETLLRVVDTGARTGGAFGTPQPPRHEGNVFGFFTGT